MARENNFSQKRQNTTRILVANVNALISDLVNTNINDIVDTQ